MVRYVSPIARVRVGDDEFLTGDRLLRFVSVTLGEDKRSSNCRFEVYDPELMLADKYFKMSFDQGGIVVPDDLLEDPKPPASSGGSGGSGSSGSSTADTTLTPELRAWLDTIAWAEGADYNVMFTGKTFSGFGDHPRAIQRSGSLASDAAGRYQFLSTTWDSLNLPDFSPPNQDKGAVMLLERRGVLAAARQGVAGIDAVLESISYEWASLPPFRYGGQGTKTRDQVVAYYTQRLQHYQTGQTPDQAAAAQQPTIADKAPSKPIESSKKGTEIIIELGYQLDQTVAYHFIHTGSSTQGRTIDSTTFEGQTVRWLMTRRTKNTTYGNITLRELAEKVAVAYGLTLEMEGDGPKFEHLDQTGITDYELLLREARSIGYCVRDEGNKLILKPWRPDFTGFVVTPDILISVNFTDRASKDRKPAVQATASTPETPAADAKTRIDRLSGQVQQTAIEDSTATGTASQPVVTGASTAPLQGTPKPESAATSRGVLSESVTGLPRQEVGAIDLADGRAEAQELKNEARRVKGYESRVSILTTPEALKLAPGSIIGISKNCVPDTFAREWRIGSLTHTLRDGRMTTDLEIYSPQAMKPAESVSGSGSGGSSSGNSSLSSTQTASGWANPMPAAGNSSCGAVCEFGYARGRLHEGLDFGGYGSGSDPDGVFAASNGIVTHAGLMGGYGYTVDIKRSDGWSSRYAHLAPNLNVQVGQEVQQGTRVGTRSGTGSGGAMQYQIHLHFELRRPDGQAVNPRDYLPQPQIPMAGG